MWTSGELSLAYLTVDGATPVQHVEAAASAGFAAAGLRILPPTHLRTQSRVVGDANAIKRLAEVCGRTGVRPLDAEVMSLTAETGPDEMTAMAEAAADLGFRYIQTVVEDTDLSRAADNVARLAGIAARAGTGVAIEFMAFRPLSTLEDALRVMQRADARNVGLLIDALHLDRSGATVNDIKALPPNSVAVIQLCDAPRARPRFEDLPSEARERRLHPGEGGLPLEALLDVLEDGLPLSLEVPHPTFAGLAFNDRAAQAMAVLKNFLAVRKRRPTTTAERP